jgi:putative ABC transport system ATP-binding protein
MVEIIRCDNLSKCYNLGKTRVHALQEVDCSIEGGEFVAIAGPSGSGKTTLLNLVGCLDKPDSGRLSLEGKDVTNEKLERLAGFRANRLGFVFQTFNLLPVLSVYENVEYPLLLKGMNATERKTRVLGMLERVGLLKRRNHWPQALSGGERQRVAIARALAGEPAVVLADEPTANLDSQTGQGIIDLMRELNAESKVTFLFSTHDPRIIRKAHRVIRLLDGRIVSNGIEREMESLELTLAGN